MIHTWRGNGNNNYKKAHKPGGFVGAGKKWKYWKMYDELEDDTLISGCDTLDGGSGHDFLSGDRTIFKEYV